MTEAAAIANANVALAKYWGKRDEALNLPYTGSISINLAGLTTTARVRFTDKRGEDRVIMSGRQVDGLEATRVRKFLDVVRQLAGRNCGAEVEVASNFPVAAGLASSASTFAALAVAATHAAGIILSEQELSRLARRGSGSAARSIHGGYVEWLRGEAADGSDSYAVQLAPPEHWPLGIVAAITDRGRKRVGSREGMAHSLTHSPFFPPWLETHQADLETIRQGILGRDLRATGSAAEHNCLKMHAVALAASPPLLYWNAATLAVMHRVIQLREEGMDAYFTIDAGPQVKVICSLPQREAIAAAIQAVPGVHDVLLSEPGAGARLVEGA
ncbi:MAG: diphosphomevalonate decarboxylase [Deltaproteobacteria bacterium]|nr:diphosphomevalonate decarboxylase [Deltaproteobacteria bacterium]